MSLFKYFLTSSLYSLDKLISASSNKLDISLDSLPNTNVSIFSLVSSSILPLAKISAPCVANTNGSSITKSTPYFKAISVLSNLSMILGIPL